MTTVIERHEVTRCRESDPETGAQCCDHVEHCGAHTAVVSSSTRITWPSRFCVEEARIEVEIDAMTDEQIDAECVAVAGGAEHLEQWKSGTMAFVRGAVKLRRDIDARDAALDACQKRIAELLAELVKLRGPLPILIEGKDGGAPCAP